MAGPELSHFIPLVYTIGLQRHGETIDDVYEAMEYGTLSMRSFIIHGGKQLKSSPIP